MTRWAVNCRYVTDDVCVFLVQDALFARCRDDAACIFVTCMNTWITLCCVMLQARRHFARLVRKRHAGVLGLSAIVQAHPYAVLRSLSLCVTVDCR